MRSIARQSVRLASHSRVRQSSRPPHLPSSQQHVRGISQSAPLRVDPRNPSGPSDHSTPVETQRDDASYRDGEEKAVAQESAAAEHKSGETKNAGVKTYKQRRKESAQKLGIPKPPPIPDWFLKHNVKLQTDTLPPNASAKNAQVLRCVDKDTGHTLFTLPYYEAWPVPGLPGRNEEKAKPENEADPKKKSLEQSFFDNRFTSPPSTQPPEEGSTGSEQSTIRTTPSEEVQTDINPHTLLRWSLLEAETSILAAFAMAVQGPQTHLHAASRLDLSLQCPDDEAHDGMDELVEDLASLTQSDVIRLDANDFEDLLIDYVESGSDAAGTFSRLAYDTYHGAVATQSGHSGEEAEEEAIDEEEEDEGEEDEDESRSSEGLDTGRPGNFGVSVDRLRDLRQNLFKHRHQLEQALGQIKITSAPLIFATSTNRPGTEKQSAYQDNLSADSVQWDEARLKSLLDSLLEAPRVKREQSKSSQPSEFRSRLWHVHADRSARLATTPSDKSYQALWRVWRSSPGCWLPDIAGVLASRVHRSIKAAPDSLPLKLEASTSSNAESAPSRSSQRTIVHVRDLMSITRTPLGQVAIDSLVRNVKKRRKAGQEILVVGTTAQVVSDMIFANTTRNDTGKDLRTITVPPFFRMSKEQQSRVESAYRLVDTAEGKATGGYGRILEINYRHIHSMLKRLRPQESIDLFSEASQAQLKLAGSYAVSHKVLSFNLIHRIVLTAIGLAEAHAKSATITTSHIALAIYATLKTDQVARLWARVSADSSSISADEDTQPKPEKTGTEKTQAKMDKLKKSCNQHESRLLGGVVDPQNIKTGFQEVHAPSETIDALKMMTSLSLLRPDAFKYGVLAADRLPGLMLYGPPGTGKTLLAKAVAKESRATVLEISGAQIYEKYVGEGEKMVRAVFSLAKKISPCIVFIDEADAIFGSRSSAGNRNTHREIINQFLREWDGMDLHNIFIMVASNRPFDMDDAVLRRLPRRLLVDLPVAKDRESILKIHLKDEVLDETVDLSKLAEQTPLYSGSDLKNVCVAAALACVREENELAESKQDEKDFKLPEKRTLSARHFEKAVKEISASISEDMSSLTAIKKFDEQFGDRKGRRKKAAYGFGIGDAGIDESAARVRDTTPPPP